MAVVLFHTAGNLAKEKYFGALGSTIAIATWSGGASGVAFFFVLSGFIMQHVHGKEVGSPRKFFGFWRKRITRIYPTYLVIFLSVYFLASWIPSLRESVQMELGVLLKSLMLLPQDPEIVGGTGAPVLIVAWSLQYEMLFYAIFSLCFFWRWAMIVVFTIFAIVFTLSIGGGEYAFPASFFCSHYCFLFGMGVLSSRVAQSKPDVCISVGCLVMTIGLLIAVSLFETYFRNDQFKVFLDVGYGIASALLLFILARREQEFGFGSTARKVSLLGDSSYALYLIHFPLIAILSKACAAFLPMNTLGVFLSFFILVFACCLSAIFFHILIERPILDFLNAKNRRRLVGTVHSVTT